MQNGELFYTQDEEREKIDMEIEVLANIIDNKPFYKMNYPILINQILQLNFPEVTVYFTITDVQKKITSN